MKLDTALYARLLREAADNPRLRQATDLRTSPADQSQRMLNALLPGTAVPVHRHPHSAETAVVLSGCLQINFLLSGSGLRSAFFCMRIYAENRDFEEKMPPKVPGLKYDVLKLKRRKGIYSLNLQYLFLCL